MVTGRGARVLVCCTEYDYWWCLRYICWAEKYDDYDGIMMIFMIWWDVGNGIMDHDDDTDEETAERPLGIIEEEKRLLQNDENTCAVARIHFHLKLHLTSDQCHWHWRWKGQFHWYLPDSGRDRLWLDIQSRWSSSLAWLYRRNPLPPEEKVDQKKEEKNDGWFYSIFIDSLTGE